MDIILFGASITGQEYVMKSKKEVAYFIDNDLRKWGKTLLGIPIHSPNVIVNLKSGTYQIVVTSVYYKEISEQLNEMGLLEGTDYVNGIEASEFYIREDLTVEAFFEELKKRDIRYVIPRHFHDLPKVRIDGDIDLLIVDQDIYQIEDLLVKDYHNRFYGSNIGRVKIDLYGVYGSIGYKYKNMALYRSDLAQILVDSYIWHKGCFRVPSKSYQSLALLYHVLYHRGLSSGIPVDDSNDARAYQERFKEDLIQYQGNHNETTNIVHYDYVDMVEECFSSLRVDYAVSLQNIHLVLRDYGWALGYDSFRKIWGSDDQVFPFYKNEKWYMSGLAAQSHHGDIMLFYFREVEKDYPVFRKVFEEEMMKNQLVTLYEGTLTEEEVAIVTQNVRGGNWTDGSGHSENGKPYKILLVYDDKPERTQPTAQDPFVTNEHFFLKRRVRDRLKLEFDIPASVNCIHSADDSLEVFHDFQFLEDPKMERIKKCLMELGFEIKG